MTEKSEQAYVLTWAKKFRFIQSQGGKCRMCGTDNPFVLTFHHLYGKKSSINHIKSGRLSIMMEEGKKGILLCENCHVELHHDNDAVDKSRQILKRMLLKYKNSDRCSVCGYVGKNQRSLEFHHISRDQKNFTISEEIWKTKGITEKIARELDKCEVLCRNCHALTKVNVDRIKQLTLIIQDKMKSYRERKKVDRTKVMELRNQGKTLTEIARELGHPKSAIFYVLKVVLKEP